MALFDYNIEPTLETALCGLFIANGIERAKRARSTDDLDKPYVGVSFALGAELPVDHPTSSGGVSSIYDGEYTVTIVTDRDLSNEQHETLRAAAREVLAESTGAQWAAALGARYHISEIRHVSTVYDVLDADTGIDASAMTYRVKLHLKQ